MKKDILDAFTANDLQRYMSLLHLAKSKGMDQDELTALITERLADFAHGVAGAKPAAHNKSNPHKCPSCGRARMRVPLDGRRHPISEPVLVCPECRYSVYGGVK